MQYSRRERHGCDSSVGRQGNEFKEHTLTIFSLFQIYPKITHAQERVALWVAFQEPKALWVAFQKPYGILPGGISGANGT